jgi:hypothetical protein
MLRLATTFPDNKEIQSLIFKLYSSLTKDSYLRSLILKAIIALASVESYLFDQKQRSSLRLFGGESPYIVDATPTSGTVGASDQSGCSPLG